MAGLTPVTADDVNNTVGNVLRQYVNSKEGVDHAQANLAAIDLTVPPYSMSPEDSLNIKSALNGLQTALDAIDMTFVNRLIGVWT